MNTGFLDNNITRIFLQRLLWESCKNLHDCTSNIFISGTSLSFAPFHLLQICLGFLLLLPLSVMVYQIQLSNVVELQQHSPHSNNTSVTTYVHRKIISPPCLFKHTKNDVHVAMLVSAFWIIHNKNSIFVSFHC